MVSPPCSPSSRVLRPRSTSSSPVKVLSSSSSSSSLPHKRRAAVPPLPPPPPSLQLLTSEAEDEQQELLHRKRPRRSISSSPSKVAAKKQAAPPEVVAPSPADVWESYSRRDRIQLPFLFRNKVPQRPQTGHDSSLFDAWERELGIVSADRDRSTISDRRSVDSAVFKLKQRLIRAGASSAPSTSHRLVSVDEYCVVNPLSSSLSSVKTIVVSTSICSFSASGLLQMHCSSGSKTQPVQLEMDISRMDGASVDSIYLVFSAEMPVAPDLSSFVARGVRTSGGSPKKSRAKVRHLCGLKLLAQRGKDNSLQIRLEKSRTSVKLIDSTSDISDPSVLSALHQHLQRRSSSLAHEPSPMLVISVSDEYTIDGGGDDDEDENSFSALTTRSRSYGRLRFVSSQEEEGDDAMCRRHEVGSTGSSRKENSAEEEDTEDAESAGKSVDESEAVELGAALGAVCPLSGRHFVTITALAAWMSVAFPRLRFDWEQRQTTTLVSVSTQADDQQQQPSVTTKYQPFFFHRNRCRLLRASAAVPLSDAGSHASTPTPAQPKLASSSIKSKKGATAGDGGARQRAQIVQRSDCGFRPHYRYLSGAVPTYLRDHAFHSWRAVETAGIRDECMQRRVSDFLDMSRLEKSYVVEWNRYAETNVHRLLSKDSRLRIFDEFVEAKSDELFRDERTRFAIHHTAGLVTLGKLSVEHACRLLDRLSRVPSCLAQPPPLSAAPASTAVAPIPVRSPSGSPRKSRVNHNLLLE